MVTAVPLCLALLAACTLIAVDAATVSPGDVSKGMDWLMRFGYLQTPDPVSSKLMTQQSITEAVKDMQRFAGITVTGNVDAATVRMMNTPRCSLPDRVGTSEIMKRRRKRYALAGSVWRKHDLTYRINSWPSRANDPATIRRIISEAFRVWSDAVPLTFREERGGVPVDIVIEFSRGYHTDAYPFDGAGGTLAHAFFPGQYELAGDTHFDDDEKWSLSPADQQGTDLFTVAVHELGHALGLGHSSADSIMRPYYQGSVGDPQQYSLMDDDKRGISHLYGSKRPTIRPPRPNPPGPHPSAKPPKKHPAKGVPDRCNTNFDAITQLRGDIFFFKGRHFWRLLRGLKLEAPEGMPIRDFWSGLPDDLQKVDAVYERSQDSKIIFLTGGDFWVFENTKADKGNPHQVKEMGLPPSGVHAAFEWYHNGKTYFFREDDFWRYDERLRRVESGYPKKLTLWKGLPNGITDVFSWTNGSTFFFKDTSYWRLSDKMLSVEPGYPRPITDWLACEDIAGGLGKGGATASTLASRGAGPLAITLAVTLALLL